MAGINVGEGKEDTPELEPSEQTLWTWINVQVQNLTNRAPSPRRDLDSSELTLVRICVLLLMTLQVIVLFCSSFFFY